MRHFKKWLNARLTGILIAVFLAPSLLFAQPETNNQNTEEDVQQEAEDMQRALDLFLRDQKLLYKKGEASFEFSAFYSTNTNTNTQDPLWQDNTGRISLIKNIHRALNTSFTIRYGLVDGLELNINLPYGYAEQRLQSIPGTKTKDHGLGDIRAGLKYQLWHEGDGTPELIVDIAYQSITGDAPLLGSDHESISLGATFVKTVDPVVFFGRIGYRWTLRQGGHEFGNVRHVSHDPGDQIAFQGGLGLSLNDRVSVNLQALGTLIMRDKLKEEGKKTRGEISEILSMQVSVTAIVSKQLSLEPVVGFGLTDNATDSYVGINIPYRF